MFPQAYQGCKRHGIAIAAPDVALLLSSTQSDPSDGHQDRPFKCGVQIKYCTATLVSSVLSRPCPMGKQYLRNFHVGQVLQSSILLHWEGVRPNSR